MRFSFRDRITDQRGYVLITAIALAVLYFGLMELMLIDSSRALREAQRFRSRIVATALAESAAELAAAQMLSTQPEASANASDEQGQMTGTLRINGDASSQVRAFELTGKGVTAGVAPVTATVKVQGRITNGNHIAIDYTFHSQ